MKTHSLITSTLLMAAVHSHGQAGASYTNFVRQVQFPTNVIWDLSVQPTGEQASALAIDPGGARFELWTVKSSPLTTYLLDTKYVGTYIPMATVSILSEDPNTYNAVPRTRADRPFIVDITTSGLRSEESAPAPSRSVTLLRHVQSYGASGDGTNLDPSQATLLHQVTLTNNATHRLSYSINSVPGANRAKVRGEERFSVFSIADHMAPPSQLSAMTIQVWPVADGAIAGISEGQVIKFQLPSITLTMNDLYPDSQTYTQVYSGSVRDGVAGTVIPGSGKPLFAGAPENETRVISAWQEAIPTDGTWTMEMLHVTPFGTDRLAAVTFEVDRTMSINGAFTTNE
jgi:hypothetical protein